MKVLLQKWKNLFTDFMSTPRKAKPSANDMCQYNTLKTSPAPVDEGTAEGERK